MKCDLQDTHYLALWDKNDLPLIGKWQEKIRNGERNEELGKLFFKLLDSKYNDHHPNPEPLDLAVDKKYLLTWNGIGKFCRLITRQDSTTFTHVAVGTGATVPQPYDIALVSEASVIDFASNGFFDGAGTSIRYAGTFGSGVPSNTFKESLVRNQATSTGSTVMCRNIFPTNPISHTSGNSGFTCAGTIEFIAYR